MFAVGHRTFAGDLAQVEDWLRLKVPFAFARFNDGEWLILSGQAIDNGEFHFDPLSPPDALARQRLLAAFRYHSPNYLVGISCTCCAEQATVAAMRTICGQPEERLTFAGLFANANYPAFKERIIPLFQSYSNIFLICHEKGDASRLPFNVRQQFSVGTNAWINNQSLVEELPQFISREKLTGALFLVSAGPFTKSIIQHLNAAHPQNTYLDTGSTLDPWIFGRTKYKWLDRLPKVFQGLPGILRGPGVTRSYHRPGRKSQRLCQWWTPASEQELWALSESCLTSLQAPADLGAGVS